MTNKKKDKSYPEIIKLIEKIPDPRIDRCKRHPLVSVIFIALTTTISEADNWIEMESQLVR